MRTIECMRARAFAAACLLTFVAAGLAAQEGPAATLRGRVVAAESGDPLPGVRLYIEGTTRVAETGPDGRFAFPAVPAGTRVLVAEFLGRGTERSIVRVRPAASDEIVIRLSPSAIPLDNVVVTTTRDAGALAQTPATVGVVGRDQIREERPTHPSQIMGKVPGVWVNTTGGEGHMTAIRQPLTTNPVYLYAEDGVPTRSTGFFNHNALYEINVPQADRIEVVKGPATALYGSDAIGGVINVSTRSGVSDPGVEGTIEGGEFGWVRFLGTAGFLLSESDGLRADVNLTRTDGWRDGTAYDRQSGTVRWDRMLGRDATLKTVLAMSRIDQQTAGSSALPEAAFEDQPRLNLTPISFREVGAVRLSAEYERRWASTSLTVTPFARHNTMDLLPNWSLTFDPAIWETENESFGVLAKVDRRFRSMDGRLIAGLDVDVSPGGRFERTIEPSRDDDGIFTEFVDGEPIYDYDVRFTGVSPYVHAEASPTDRLRLTAGLRFDHVGYDYDNALGELQTGPHRRPGSSTVAFNELSPKVGATLEMGGGASVFAAYGHGFRAPSEGQLFRQGSAENTLGLEPVKADNLEAGLRGTVGGVFRYSLSGYWLRKTDDILTFQRDDDVRETRNAGETLHRGVEVGLDAALGAGVSTGIAVSYAKHTYEDWSPDAATDFSGMEMEDAPRTIANANVTWRPSFHAGSDLSLEWAHLGSYYLDPANTQEYEGHNLLSLRGSAPITGRATVFARLSNLTDERYAETAGFSAFRGREFAPGMPRTFYVGLRLR
jgi:iron complex outermembrane receptor protein